MVIVRRGRGREDDRLVDNNLAQVVRDRRRLGRGRGRQWAASAHWMVVMQAAFHQPVESSTFLRAPAPAFAASFKV